MVQNFYRPAIAASSILDGLILPPVAAGAPLLVLMVGLPGAGKSTLARRLAPAIDAVVLESDALRQRFFTPPTYARRESKLLFGAMREAAHGLLQRNVSVIIDATNVLVADRAPFLLLGRSLQTPVVQLYVTAPDTESRRRLALRAAGNDPFDRSTAGLAIYEQMRDRLEEPDESAWRIDTSDTIKSEQTLDLVIKACRAAVSAGKEEGITA
jgi:predicted kinase